MFDFLVTENGLIIWGRVFLQICLVHLDLIRMLNIFTYLSSQNLAVFTHSRNCEFFQKFKSFGFLGHSIFSHKRKRFATVSKTWTLCIVLFQLDICWWRLVFFHFTFKSRKFATKQNSAHRTRLRDLPGQSTALVFGLKHMRQQLCTITSSNPRTSSSVVVFVPSTGWNNRFEKKNLFK